MSFQEEVGNRAIGKRQLEHSAVGFVTSARKSMQTSARQTKNNRHESISVFWTTMTLETSIRSLHIVSSH